MDSAAKYTAIVLSASPVTLIIPGVRVLGRVQTIATAAQLHDARLDALADVETEFCFYLDDDDELPPDYLDVLAQCAAAGSPLAYTDEMMVSATDSVHLTSGAYSRARHLENAMLVHHLAVMRTSAASATARNIPRGAYWTEMLLYFKLAEGGAAYIPRVGYIWNRRPGGLSNKPHTLISQVASMTWCNRS